MSPSSAKKTWVGAWGGMSWPLLVGAAACSAFYVLILQGPLHSPFMMRYFASHPVLYVETGMFCVGLAALLIKAGELARQARALRHIELARPAVGDPPGQCRDFLAQIALLPRSLRRTYLADRLVSALRYVERKGASQGLDDELKYLADLDAAKQQDGYALVRIVAWATPMMGFLGTVVGITHALGGLDYKLFATDVSAAMQGLMAGLYVAFDTTALALVLSIILMFVMFFADRVETSLLTAVDEFVHDWMVTRFPDEGGWSQGPVGAVERMSSAVVKTMETLIRQQTDQWKTAIEQTHQHLGAVTQAAGEQVRTAVGESLDNSLKNHAERLARFEFEADQQMRARWEQWQSALAENLRVARDQQHEVGRQTEVLTRIVSATGEIARLEDSLNRNLQTLNATRRFEDTVLSLSAAIQLLSTRLSPDSPSPVELRAPAQGRAA